MIPAIGALLAKPAVKYGGIALLAIGLVVGALWYVESVRRAERKAGANEVITDVQRQTIEETDRARKERDRVKENIRRTPIDDLIDRM